MGELPLRAKKILFAAVTEFIATGEPVGSRTLARKYDIDLSAASIRNVLSDLEEEGYFHQPHTSAGRVPTDRAFRLFIDALGQVRQLSEAQRSAIERRFAQLEPGADALRETALLLSGLSGTAAVVVAPRLSVQTLRQLRFIPTRSFPGGGAEVLVVVVSASGQVENRFVRVDVAPASAELERIHNLLDDVIEGRTLREVRELFARRLQDTKSELGEVRRRAFELGAAALDAEGTGPVELVIEGEAQLLDKPEFADIDRIKALVRALAEREKLVSILDRALASKGVHVLLSGEGDDALGVDQLSLVGTRYAVDGDARGQGAVAGAVGVIGPTRMDYASIVPLVDETARGLGAWLSSQRTNDDD